MERETLIKHTQIVQRAKAKGLLAFDEISLLMDLEAAQIAYNIDCDAILAADDLNFAHDICGIQANINRQKTSFLTQPPMIVFDNCFLPRFARAEL